jgi:hypothetical protein
MSVIADNRIVRYAYYRLSATKLYVYVVCKSRHYVNPAFTYVNHVTAFTYVNPVKVPKTAFTYINPVNVPKIAFIYIRCLNNILFFNIR